MQIYITEYKYILSLNINIFSKMSNIFEYKYIFTEHKNKFLLQTSNYSRSVCQ